MTAAKVISYVKAGFQ